MTTNKPRGQKVLPPVRPNAGVQAQYRGKLERWIAAMQKSVVYHLERAYRGNEPEVAQLAQDESPADALRRTMRRLGKQWQKQFDDLAPALAEYFAKAFADRSDVQLRAILRKGGFSVRFKMTPAMRDIIDATVHENVNLIKSIPQQYLKDVEGIVMRGVQTGRDLGQISRDLQDAHGVTRRRAALIARDQSNKATGAMQRARQLELGIKRAVWIHSHGGRKPRPTHLANDGKEYDVAKGWFDPHERKWILPGELISCRCVSGSVVKGFS